MVLSSFQGINSLNNVIGMHLFPAAIGSVSLRVHPKVVSFLVITSGELIGCVCPTAIWWCKVNYWPCGFLGIY